MSVTEIVGILLAAGGMYFALIERASSGNSPVEKETSDGESSPKFSISRSAVFQSAIFAGLAILGLSHSSCAELLPRSMLTGGMRGIVFGQGACLVLAGAIGVVFSSTARAVVFSAAILGTGGATVLGVSGNAIIGGLLVAGAALCGWWLYASFHSKSAANHSQPGDRENNETAIERALNDDLQSTPEPLLTSVAIVLFCWILGSTLQSAVEEGTGSKMVMSGSSRALPRPAFDRSAQQKASDGPDVTNATESTSTRSSRDNTLFWCAAGLLVATIGLGYSRAESKFDTSPAAEADNSV